MMNASPCVWCNARVNHGDTLLCSECLGDLRRMLGINRVDLEAAKRTGFFRKSDLGILVDRAMNGLDQLEEHSWLDKSIEAAKKQKRV